MAECSACYRERAGSSPASRLFKKLELKLELKLEYPRPPNTAGCVL